MNADLLRNFAARCRELMRAARTRPAREQLGLWAEEFDSKAEALERELARQKSRRGDSE